MTTTPDNPNTPDDLGPPPRDELDAMLRTWHDANAERAAAGRDRLVRTLVEQGQEKEQVHIGILISIELILNAVNVNFVAFSRTSSLAPETGQVFAIFVIAIAAAALAVGLAIVLALYRTHKTVFIDEINLLKW